MRRFQLLLLSVQNAGLARIDRKSDRGADIVNLGIAAVRRIDGDAMRSHRYDITDIAAQKFAMLDRSGKIAPLRRQSHVMRPERYASIAGFGHA
jgi:hypothetical protein